MALHAGRCEMAILAGKCEVARLQAWAFSCSVGACSSCYICPLLFTGMAAFLAEFRSPECSELHIFQCSDLVCSIPAPAAAVCHICSARCGNHQLLEPTYFVSACALLVLHQQLMRYTTLFGTATFALTCSLESSRSLAAVRCWLVYSHFP